jgi:hypothetical protein
MTFAAFALGAFVHALGSACEASRAEDLGPTVELKPGQEIAFPVAIVDGHVALGKPRLLRPGAAQPEEGEIAVGVVKHDSSPYADLTASERTAAPVNFVATGLIGNIKIDEVKLCGRLDAPTSAHIYSGSWRISLNRFSVGHSGEAAHESFAQKPLRALGRWATTIGRSARHGRWQNTRRRAMRPRSLAHKEKGLDLPSLDHA